MSSLCYKSSGADSSLCGESQLFLGHVPLTIQSAASAMTCADRFHKHHYVTGIPYLHPFSSHKLFSIHSTNFFTIPSHLLERNVSSTYIRPSHAIAPKLVAPTTNILIVSAHTTYHRVAKYTVFFLTNLEERSSNPLDNCFTYKSFLLEKIYIRYAMSLITFCLHLFFFHCKKTFLTPCRRLSP